MHTPDLFPAELAAAQGELAAVGPYEPPDEFYDDDHTEEPEPIERSWQEIAADEACVTLYGAL